MNIKMLTTSFPKFPGDSHAPWILSMSSALVRLGHSVTVVAPSADDLERKDAFQGVKVVRFRYMLKSLECVAYGANIPANLAASVRARFVFPFFVVGFFRAAMKLAHQADIVHAQFGYSGLFAALARRVASVRRRPLIISFYGRDIAHASLYPILYREAFLRATRILALSGDMKRRLVATGCPEKKIVVHHLGVDCRIFDGDQTAADVGHETVFLIVANFVEKKGIEVGLEAFARLASRLKNVRLRIVGRGPLEGKLKAIAFNSECSDRVAFINNYEMPNPRQCVLDEMRRAHVFVLPSVSSAGDYGGTPVVLMEAAAMKLPTITTDNAGNAEVVIDGKSGIIVREGDPEALRCAMELLATSTRMRTSFGEYARQHVCDHFEQGRQTRRLEEIYNSHL